MAQNNFETKVLLTALAEAFRIAGTRVANVFNFLIDWRIARLSNRDTAHKEIDATIFAQKIGNYSAKKFALAEHQHDNYYKVSDKVKAARGIFRNGKVYLTEELALAEHDHEEYAKEGEFKVAAKAIEGTKPEELALKNHEHEEYIKMDEIVDAAEMIGGMRYSDFATEDHSHFDEYYAKNEMVDDALFLVNPDNPDELYSAEDFAPKEHTHDEYFTVDEFISLFLMNDEPYWVSDTIELTVVDVEAGNQLMINESQAVYELLQSPFAQVPMRPAASIDTTIKNTRTVNARVVFIRNVGISIGRYITLELQLPSTSPVNILGVFPALRATSATANLPIQVPVIGAFNENKLTIFAPPFRNASQSLDNAEINSGSVLVDLMIIVECNLASTIKKVIGVVNK